MKKAILLGVCVLFAYYLCSQTPPDSGIYPPDMDKYHVLDSADYKFVYEFTHVPDSTKINSTLKNQLVLLIGDNISRFYSAECFRADPSAKVNKTRDTPIKMLPGHGLNATEVFKNKKTGKQTVTTRLSGTNDIYSYQEDIPKLKWTITNQTATILSYPCTKAYTTFRGRTYEAWFTTSIPINNGPWKLGGLPGLILKASDSRNFFTFNCIGIEKLKTKEPIVKYDAKYVASSRKDVNKLVRNLHVHPVQTYEGFGLTYIGDKPIPAKPYNPLERD
ncbi:GLPGLI family protein [Prevotella sp. 10(H)]|uniref:GLPGLI family protein n=1 Tax=Prevotella sp. 10(H) TaxID=1158294 RepID=UPI000B148C8B|nr:GLPGLI family protein [Prevotella sp. 10(H)]